MSPINNNEKDSNKRDRENEGNNEEILELNKEQDSRSPIAKKSRRELGRMESWKDSNADQELIKITIVINDLITKTANDQIKKLIDCYNPLIHEEIDMMMNHISSCYETWQNKEEVLKEAIRYVWPEIDVEIDEINEAEKLAEILLISIETLMPKYCKECDHHYIVKREDTPTIRCMWCKGGAHDCVDRGNKEKLKGMIWMCKVCNDTVTKQIIPKISLVKKMELVKKEISINFEGFETRKEKDDEKEEVEEDRPGGEDINLEVNEGNGNDNKEKEKKNDESNDNKKICWFYENRKCKFGEKCKDLHPEVCKPMAEYGKCRDSKCKLLHQKICRNYYNQGDCPRYNCWFVHPSKIRQRNPERTSTHGPQQEINNHRSNVNNANQYMRINETQYDNMNNNANFLWNWPTPPQTSMNMQQILTRLVGTMEKVDSRIEKLEMRHVNRW